MRHDELRKTWVQGDIWETKVENQEIWVPVGDHGLAEPVWDQHQEYRKSPFQVKQFGIHDSIETVKAINQAFLSNTPIEIDGVMAEIVEFVMQYTPKWNVFVKYRVV